MSANDTTFYTVHANLDTISKNIDKSYIIEIAQTKNEDSDYLTHPLLISFLFPLIITLITFWITRTITRKKEKTEINKIKTETEKYKAEINQIKTSFQPIVISSLQNVQDHIFKEKTDSLKGLIYSKSELFNVKNIYHEGESNIIDEYAYYQDVYLNLSDQYMEKIKLNAFNNSSFFPDMIRNNFQELINQLYDVFDTQNREFSVQNQDMPSGVDKQLENISKLFDNLINEIRNDLHLNNTFIHDFIEKNQIKSD